MQIHFIGGATKRGELVAVAIGISTSPSSQVAALKKASPFHGLSLLGVEAGSQERLETIKNEFATLAMGGPWFKASEELLQRIKSLEPAVDKKDSRRVSLDLDPEEWAMLETMVEELGEKMKSKVLRRSLKFYRSLLRYKAKGYMIQAIRGGELIQFPELDDIREKS